MLRINNIKIYENLSKNDLLDFILTKYNIKKSDVINWKISKQSIDARKKDDIHFLYSIDLNLKNEKNFLKYKNISQILEDDQKYISRKSINITNTKHLKPVIVGSGPAGLFVALQFIDNGICPIIIEQGEPVEQRKLSIENFSNHADINPYSNIQFGEGGAGTFSDGKLNSNINSPLCKNVLETFVKFGAPEQILYLNKPHIGTDNLIKIIKNMRKYIISKGGTFLFNTKFIDFETTNNSISNVHVINLLTNKIECITTNILILAIGHSSRETFYKLYEKNLILEPKNFSVGVRIEHLQKDINLAQYGNITKLNLPVADYKLAYHDQNGRSCYTFCMCPGGLVVPASSEHNAVVTNGMSYFKRDGVNANSAVLVNVTPDDFKNGHPLSGIDFQKNLEQQAFKLGGSNYYAPVQRFEDFLLNKKSTFIGKIIPSYKPGYTLSNLNEILPPFVSETLKNGILHFNTKLDGFSNPDSILTGVETRSSSPVRILRNSDFVCNIAGIYPCGEGAGYAGGIMSAAVDGIKCASSIINLHF